MRVCVRVGDSGIFSGDRTTCVNIYFLIENRKKSILLAVIVAD